MTFREKLEIEHPECVSSKYVGGCRSCPCYYGYVEDYCDDCTPHEKKCRKCWDKEIPEEYHDTKYNSRIKAIFNRQRKKGIETYGQTLEENNKVDAISKIDYIQEELADAMMYMEWLREEFLKTLDDLK